MSNTIASKNITIKYDDGLTPDIKRQNALVEKINLRLELVIEEINNQSGTIDCLLLKNGRNSVVFIGFTPELYTKMERLWDNPSCA